jgi:hypothetical protein
VADGGTALASDGAVVTMLNDCVEESTGVLLIPSGRRSCWLLAGSNLLEGYDYSMFVIREEDVPLTSQYNSGSWLPASCQHTRAKHPGSLKR